MQDTERARKRKRGNIGNNSGSQVSGSESRLVSDESLYDKKPTNESLSKSIASLYESIMSAKEELEAGGSFITEAFSNM
jgi:hypothetical protein